MKTSPASTKPCDDGGAAASQIERCGGTMFGHIPATSPAKPSTNSASASTKGRSSSPRRAETQSSAEATTTSRGIGMSQRKRPPSNQAAITSLRRNGSHAETSAMNASTATSSGRVRSSAIRCTRPSVLSTSQVAPSSAYPNTSATPVSIENGLNQSNAPPTYLPA